MSRLLTCIEEFTPEEVSVALELIDLAVTPNHPDYQALVATREDRVVGYVLYGPTPMTDGTFDLYWIATSPEARGTGAGWRLVEAMEAELRGRGGRLIRVETSSQEAYGATLKFYSRTHFKEEARIRDFYKPGDDLIVLTKRL